MPAATLFAPKPAGGAGGGERLKRETMELRELCQQAREDLPEKLKGRLDLSGQDFEQFLEGYAYWVCMGVSEGTRYDRILEEYATLAHERAKGWARGSSENLICSPTRCEARGVRCWTWGRATGGRWRSTGGWA